MRTIRLIMSIIIAIAVVLALGSLSSAHSANSDSGWKAVYPNSWQPGINQPCPKGSQKIIIATFTVPKRQKIKDAMEFLLELKTGDFLFDEPYWVNQRRVEYYLFPQSRNAKVLLNDFTDSLAYAKYTGTYYRLHLAGDCLEEYAG